MKNINIHENIEQQRLFFNTRITFDIQYRIVALKTFKATIQKYESEIFESLYQDLHKSDFESYMTEVSIVLNEIDYYIKNLKKWAKPKQKKSPLLIFPSKSYILKEPYGVVLIISPWNYPFHLILNPLIAAIGAGNVAVLKTSPYAPQTAKIIDTIISECFSNKYVSVYHGNRDVNQSLLTEKFDYIFFTGSPDLGKIVMKAASEHLTPITLELGGKSPCIIDKDADLKIAAKRIVFGKTINCGQTCIAPDYLMVHHDIKDSLIREMRTAIEQMFGKDPLLSKDYPRIVSDKAMNKLLGYLNEGDIILGGHYQQQEHYLEPTIITNIPHNANILKDEIFGPIFPLIEFSKLDEVINYINSHEKPLALYYFSQNKKSVKKILKETSSGGVCINETLLHIINPRIPFGGVGYSGMGHYHGKFGFETLTHSKAVIKSLAHIDIPIKYPPFFGKLKRFKRFI